MSKWGEIQRFMIDRGEDPDDVIFLIEVGSTAHGCGVSEQDDYDYTAVRLESFKELMGDVQKPKQIRTAKEGERSGPGDIDLTIYPFRKYAQLVAGGNPNIITSLFDDRAIFEHRLFPRSMLILSIDERKALKSFLGYLKQQIARWEEGPIGSGRGKGRARPELVEKYGFDTKFAYHAMRLAHQGKEFMTTGRIAQPIESPMRERLRAVRVGEVPEAEVRHFCANYVTWLSLQLLKGHSEPLIPAAEVSEALYREFFDAWRA